MNKETTDSENVLVETCPEDRVDFYNSPEFRRCMLEVK